jgi:hypothetical protein
MIDLIHTRREYETNGTKRNKRKVLVCFVLFRLFRILVFSLLFCLLELMKWTLVRSSILGVLV